MPFLDPVITSGYSLGDLKLYILNQGARFYTI
jgi:hypothetical protein